MHHKVVIFGKNGTNNDQPLVITGCFNFTGGANKRNAENIVILNDGPSIQKFADEFCTLWHKSTPIKPEDCVYKGKNPKSPAGRKLNNIPAGIAD